MIQKGIFLILIAAILAVFCNCLFVSPSHACCEQEIQVSGQVPINDHSMACCQIKAALVTASAQTSDSIPLDDWHPAPKPPVTAQKQSALDGQKQSALAQVFIEDQSRRRCLEFCVLLN